MTMGPGPERPLFVELPFQIKTYDIDFAAHVSNIVYIRWLEDLRLEILNRYFPLDAQMEQGYAPVLVKTEISYKNALRLGDAVVGRMWGSSLGRVKFSLTGAFTCAEDVAATFNQTGVFASLKTGRAIPVPEGLREVYEAHLAGSQQ